MNWHIDKVYHIAVDMFVNVHQLKLSNLIPLCIGLFLENIFFFHFEWIHLFFFLQSGQFKHIQIEMNWRIFFFVRSNSILIFPFNLAEFTQEDKCAIITRCGFNMLEAQNDFPAKGESIWNSMNAMLMSTSCFYRSKKSERAKLCT